MGGAGVAAGQELVPAMQEEHRKQAAEGRAARFQGAQRPLNAVQLTMTGLGAASSSPSPPSWPSSPPSSPSCSAELQETTRALSSQPPAAGLLLAAPAAAGCRLLSSCLAPHPAHLVLALVLALLRRRRGAALGRRRVRLALLVAAVRELALLLHLLHLLLALVVARRVALLHGCSCPARAAMVHKQQAAMSGGGGGSSSGQCLWPCLLQSRRVKAAGQHRPTADSGAGVAQGARQSRRRAITAAQGFRTDCRAFVELGPHPSAGIWRGHALLACREERAAANAADRSLAELGS